MDDQRSSKNNGGFTFRLVVGILFCQLTGGHINKLRSLVIQLFIKMQLLFLNGSEWGGNGSEGN